MGRFLVGEGEELLRSFRPHLMSYLRSYAAAGLWLAWGALAQIAGALVAPAWTFVTSHATFVAVVMIHGAARAAGPRSGRLVWTTHTSVAVVAVITLVALLLEVKPLAAYSGFLPLALGAVVTAGSLVSREAGRGATEVYMTTQRVVKRQGVMRRTERVLLWSEVKAVEATQGVVGRMFGFGRIRLVVGKKRTRTVQRKKKTEHEVETEQEDVVEVSGAPSFDEARRDVNDLVHEVRLSDEQRQRRIEERRLRDAMVRLANWRKPAGRRGI